MKAKIACQSGHQEIAEAYEKMAKNMATIHEEHLIDFNGLNQS